jgi:hypothetical protein
MLCHHPIYLPFQPPLSTFLTKGLPITPTEACTSTYVTQRPIALQTLGFKSFHELDFQGNARDTDAIELDILLSGVWEIRPTASPTGPIFILNHQWFLSEGGCE